LLWQSNISENKANNYTFSSFGAGKSGFTKQNLKKKTIDLIEMPVLKVAI